VHLKYRIATLRIRAGGAIALRTDRDGPWDPVRIVFARRAVRPWVIKIELVDGSHLYLRPCLPGEAAITEFGRDIGGIADTEKLGDDPVSGVIAVLGIAFTCWPRRSSLLPTGAAPGSRPVCVASSRRVERAGRPTDDLSSTRRAGAPSARAQAAW
jgi:hypothetical protein